MIGYVNVLQAFERIILIIIPKQYCDNTTNNLGKQGSEQGRLSMGQNS